MVAIAGEVIDQSIPEQIMIVSIDFEKARAYNISHMSATVDQDFINRMSASLDRFKAKKDGSYNFRCPYCGDSQKNKYKARGYFFLNEKKNRYAYMCHNCGISCLLKTFIENHAPHLAADYRIESFRDHNLRTSGIPSGLLKDKTPEVVFKQTSSKPAFRAKHLDLMDQHGTVLASLDENHPAVVYANSRLLPDDTLKRVYWVDDFAALARNLDPSKTELHEDGRIVFPMRDRHGYLFAVNGRSIDPASNLRYISIRRPDRNDPKIYGLDRFDPDRHGYVTEGPIDSEFLPNALAMAGASATNSLPFDLQKVTLIYDNEPRNQDIVKIMARMISRGASIFIWPKDCPYKDINEAVTNGVSPEAMKTYIDNRTYSGLRAELELANWTRV